MELEAVVRSAIVVGREGAIVVGREGAIVRGCGEKQSLILYDRDRLSLLASFQIV